MIILVDDIEQVDDYVKVRALVEDSVLVYPGSWYDPPEYGPAMCSSSFYLEEDEELPKEEKELLSYLEKLDLDWVALPKDYDY